MDTTKMENQMEKKLNNEMEIKVVRAANNIPYVVNSTHITDGHGFLIREYIMDYTKLPK